MIGDHEKWAQKDLAIALMRFEMDEPHEDNEVKPYFPEISLEKFNSYLAEEHFGDCTNQCAACVRCQAEYAMRKAKWLCEAMA